jgi:hypothetical protein
MKILRLTVLVCVVTLLILAGTGPSVATESKFGPSDDVCVRDDYPNTLGTPSGSLLYVGGHIPGLEANEYWATFIKFDLSSFGDDTVDSAKVYLTAQAYSGSGRWVSAYEVTNDPYDWDENNMSWAYAESILTISGTVADNVFVDTVDTPGELVLDVTAEARNHKGDDFSLCLEEGSQPTSGSWAKLYSKDYVTTTYRPYIRIIYTEPQDGQDRLIGWEGFVETVLGLYGTGIPPILAFNVGAPAPVFGGLRSLELQDNSPTETPQAYLAWITGLTDGDSVYVEFWRYDETPGAAPSCCLWAHWNDSGSCDGYDGSAGGNSDYGPGTGWDLTSHSWVVSGGHTGLVIECRTYSNPGDIVWVDEMYIYVSNVDATIHGPDAGPTAVQSTSWSGIKKLYR